MESRFDVLAKALASTDGMPRWDVLQRIAGALVATAVTSWVGTGCAGVPQVSTRPPSGAGPGGRAPAGQGQQGGNDDGNHGGGNQGGDDGGDGNCQNCANPSPSPGPKCEDAKFPAGSVNVGLGQITVCAPNHNAAIAGARAGFVPLAGAQADTLCNAFDSCNPPKSTCKHEQRGLVVEVTCMETQTNCTPPQQGKSEWTCSGALKGIPAGCTCRR